MRSWLTSMVPGVGLAMLAAACGGGSAPAPSVLGTGGDGIPRCEDVPQIAPADEHLREQPIYVANEQPIEALQSWASGQPGFEQLWIDRDHQGWVVLAFSQDAEARQAELREAFPDAGGVVVGVDWTMAELEELQARVPQEPGFSSWVSATQGVVGVDVGALTDERVALVSEHLVGERVCISGVDLATLPSEGPQPQAGEGWRLLGNEPTGESYRTGIAADPEAYGRLWAQAGLRAEPPAVAFETEVVIWFGAVYSGSCPQIRLDDVVVDRERALVHAQIVQLEASGGCTADANPRAYVVAVERSALPDGRFAIQLGADDPPAGAPEERTVVDVDLTQPGSTLQEGQAGPDPSLAEPQPTVMQPGDIIEVGFPARFRFYLHCGPQWLGPLNDAMWRSEVTTTPEAWRQAMDSDEELVVEVLIETDPTRLTATANGTSVRYAPTAEQPPGCD